MSLFQIVILCLATCSLDIVEANLLSGNNQNVNFIDDPSKHAIDFSGAVPGPDGIVCVERKKYVDKTEKDQLKECFVQNVTQCYYTYITEYSEAEQEKCHDFYWKTCKIVFKERVFNATSRVCKKPLIKKCDDQSSFNNNVEPKIVCETFFETACNTTDVVPAPGDEPLPVTFCDKIPRKICAPDNCRVVEDIERCEESSDQSTIEQPIEICDLSPQKHCSQEKISVPRLVPEQKCRLIEKEICNTQLVNPHEVKRPVVIKYCAKKERVKSASSYLPPPSQFQPVDLPPPVYSSPRPAAPPVYSSPTPSSYRTTFSTSNAALRTKRDPDVPIVIEANPVWTPEGNDELQQPKSGSWANRRADAPEGNSEFSKRASRSLKLEDSHWNPLRPLL